MPKRVEVTRAGDLPIAAQLAEMQRWLGEEGVRATDLHAVRILNARVTYEATFQDAAAAARFVQAFGRGV